jgi:hypothetical protein
MSLTYTKIQNFKARNNGKKRAFRVCGSVTARALLYFFVGKFFYFRVVMKSMLFVSIIAGSGDPAFFIVL